MIVETEILENVEINHAPIKYWVSMTDKFFSRVQRITSKLIISCETYQQALIVEANALNRSEMKYVNICHKKPYYPSWYMVYEHGKHLGDYESWFKLDYFKRN